MLAAEAAGSAQPASARAASAAAGVSLSSCTSTCAGSCDEVVVVLPGGARVSAQRTARVGGGGVGYVGAPRAGAGGEAEEEVCAGDAGVHGARDPG